MYAGYEKYVYKVVLGFDIEIYKTKVYDVFINGEWFKSSNSLEVVQSHLFEYLLNQVDLEDRTTENVMKIFFDIQLLISICKQEFKE